MPRVAVLSNGHVLAAYLHEDGNGMFRVHGIVWNGSVWQPLDGGNPLDAAPTGVGTVAVAPDGPGRGIIAYGTYDEDEIETAKLYSLLVNGTNVASLNAGAELQAPGVTYEIPNISLAVFPYGGGMMVFSQAVGADYEVFARPWESDAEPPAEEPPAEEPPAEEPPVEPATEDPAGGTPAAEPVTKDEAEVIHNVFHPDRGERARVVFRITSTKRVRLALFTISGRLIKVLVDGVQPAGEHVCEWDGRNARTQPVAAGVSILVAQLGDARHTSKLVVIR